MQLKWAEIKGVSDANSINILSAKKQDHKYSSNSTRNANNDAIDVCVQRLVDTQKTVLTGSREFKAHYCKVHTQTRRYSKVCHGQTSAICTTR